MLRSAGVSRLSLVFPLLLAVVASPACASIDDDVASSEAASRERMDKAREDMLAKCVKESDGLDSGRRAECMSGFLNDVLQGELDDLVRDERMPPLDKPASTDVLKTRPEIRVGDTDCFDGRVGVLSTNKDVLAVWDQGIYAIDFLKKAFQATQGVQTRWFNTVELCPSDQVEAKSEHAYESWLNKVRWKLAQGALPEKGILHLAWPTLFIGVPMKNSEKSPDPEQIMTSTNLRDAWKDGAHLHGLPFLLTPLNQRSWRPSTWLTPDIRAWSVIDPLGDKGQALRAVAQARAESFKATLSELKSDLEKETDSREALDSAIKTNTNLYASFVPGSTRTEDGQSRNPAASCVEDQLGKLSSGQIDELVDKWMESTTSPRSANALAEVVLTAQQHASTGAKTDLRYDDKADQRCLVATRNAHVIVVNVSMATTMMRKFSPFVELPAPPENMTRDVKIETKQVGFVCVTANDFVSVDLNLEIPQKSLETGALLDAIQKVTGKNCTDNLPVPTKDATR